MALLARLALLLGAAMLAHAAYSAREHSALLAQLQPAAAAVTASLALPTSLPLDIALETLASLTLILPALAALSAPLQPIRHAQYAASADHGAFRRRRIDRAARGDVVLHGPGHEEGYAWLDKGRRRGFADVRAMRQEFADWVRAKDS